jgi:micrococcal nuclease
LVLLAPTPGCDTNPRPATDSSDFPAKVVGISDGDTLTVLTANKTQVKIRLHGIDCPESGQDFGSRAKEATSELTFGKKVTIHPRDTDRYGRTVADVILPDGRSLNHELVSAGYAWWFRKYATNDRDLARLEADARTARRGLWAALNPVPPWDWRAGVGTPATAQVIGNKRTRLYHVRTAAVWRS